MSRPYSLDLRDRVVASVEGGRSCRETARLFEVSVASVVKWSQRKRRTGSAAASPMGWRNRPLRLAGERGWLLERVAAQPDLTLRAVQGELAARDVRVSLKAIWNFFRVERLTFKKKPLHAAEQDRPDVARRRAQWKRYQGRIDPKRLVFIDETWAKTNMTRLHGRCRCGDRLVAKVPHGRWRTLTFLAALRSDRIEAPCVIDGPINGRSFLAYVEQMLVPVLRRGDVVIMDNLGSHKRQAIRRAIRAAGAKLLFLPAYSPDLNPIEQVFAKLKALLRKLDARTVETTWRGIGHLLDAFTPGECANYFRNSGYASA
ncbi:MAG: IS630 family transposase [Acidobacteria bacterium]|nr:IS630 family transposase [Acidobacteriota bacterium]